MQIYRSQLIKAALIIILIITGLIYLKTASFGFVNWDDDENIRTNVHYKDFTCDNLKYHYENSRYKAIAIWSFMMDAKIFGSKANGFHIHNLLLHLVNILIVFFLIRKITQKDIIALTTAALFALHPVFVEPVAWVTGRKDLLFVLFSLLSVLSYLQYLEKKNKILWMLMVIILVYLASLAKIQAVTLPLIFVIIDWYARRKFSYNLLVEKIMMLLLIFDKWNIFFFFLFLFIILYLVPKSKPYIKIIGDKRSSLIFWYLLGICFIIIGYIILSFHLKGEEKKTVLDAPRALIIWALYLIIYMVIFFLVLKNKTKIILKLSQISINKKLFILIIPFVILFLELFLEAIIRSNFWSRPFFSFWSNHPGSENYFSLWERLILAPNALWYYISRFFLLSVQDPMIPYPGRSETGLLPAGMVTTGIIVYTVFAVILFFIFRYIRKNRLPLLGFLWFLASISIVMHIIPIEGRVLAADRYAYSSYIGLFMVIGVTADFLLRKSYKTYVILAMIAVLLFLGIKTYIDIGTWKNSKTLWQRALKVNPNNHYAMYSLSLAYFAEDKNPEKALKYLDNALRLKGDFQYFNNRGRIRYAVGNIPGALQDINKSIELDSASFAAYNNRGAIEQQIGNFKNALSDYNKAISINPGYTEASNNRAKVLRLIQLDSILINNLEVPQEMQEDMTGFINKVSEIFITKKDFDKAAFYLTKGIKLYPTIQSFHEKLAVMYQLNKDYQKALDAYNRGLFYLHDNPALLFGRGILFLDKGDTATACRDLKAAALLGQPDAANLSRQLCGN